MKPVVAILAFAAVTALTAAGCRSTGGNGLAAAVSRSASAATDTSGIDTADATVRIENTKFADMTVYVLSEGGMRLRVGLANGNNTSILVIPRTAVLSGADIRFLLHPIGGGRDELTDKIYVQPGDEVVLTLMP